MGSESRLSGWCEKKTFNPRGTAKGGRAKMRQGGKKGGLLESPGEEYERAFQKREMGVRGGSPGGKLGRSKEIP